MKKMLMVATCSLVAGCATNSRVDALESRLARIERDLYRIEEKSAPRQEVKGKSEEPKLNPVKGVDVKVADARIDAFLKEYLGMQFGDSIEKFPKEPGRPAPAGREIPVLKSFRYYNKAIGAFIDGKLCAVYYYADIESKYSLDSTKAQFKKSFEDLAATLGLVVRQKYGSRPEPHVMVAPEVEAPNTRRNRAWRNSDYDGYQVEEWTAESWQTPEGFHRMGVLFCDSALKKLLKANANATGEVLPEAK